MFIRLVEVDKVSISSTFYARIFCLNVFSAAFLYLRVSRKSCAKHLHMKKFAHKMFMKLTQAEKLLHSARQQRK